MNQPDYWIDDKCPDDVAKVIKRISDQHSNPSITTNVGRVYVHASDQGLYVGSNNAMTNPERAFDVEAHSRSDAYYKATNRMPIAMVSHIPWYAVPSVTYHAARIEVQVYDAIDALGKYQFLNSSAPTGMAAGGSKPWASSKQHHQLLAFYLMPLLERIWNEVPVRHGRHNIQNAKNPNRKLRFQTMAEATSSTANEISNPSANWLKRSQDWVAAAMGINVSYGLQSHGSTIGWLSSFTNDQGGDWRKLYYEFHGAEDWQASLEGVKPSIPQMDELFEAFKLSVVTNDGEIILPEKPIIELTYQTPIALALGFEPQPLPKRIAHPKRKRNLKHQLDEPSTTIDDIFKRAVQ